MTAIQKLLGDILNRRITAELAKEPASRDFTEIEYAADVFLADGKLTLEQYAEFKGMIAATS